VTSCINPSVRIVTKIHKGCLWTPTYIFHLSEGNTSEPSLPLHPTSMLLFRPDNDNRENPSCRHPEKASDSEARLKERGSRLPRDIFVESYQFSPSEESAEMAGFVEGTEIPLPRRSSLRESSSEAAGCREKVGVSVSGGTSKETTPSECSSRSRNRCNFSQFEIYAIRYVAVPVLKLKGGGDYARERFGYPGTSVADP
jgi:hypothetical protein